MQKILLLTKQALNFKNRFLKKYITICALIFLLIIGVLLIGFSITTDGSLNFGYAINPNHTIDFLAIGLGTLSCLIVAIGLNLAGEAAQCLTRNILASPFTLGLTPIMTLSYLISSFFGAGLPLWAIGLMAIAIMFFLNILPNYLIARSTYKTNNNLIILYGLSLAILISSIISLLSFFTKDKNFNVLGWMIVDFVNFSEEKLYYSLGFLALGIIIFLSIVKKIHIIASTYFKASTLNVNVPLVNLLALFSISLMCVGAFIAYAPFTLLGFAIPYITKKLVIKNFDIRWSLLPSTLISILVLLLSYIVNCYLQTYLDVVLTIMMLPFLILMVWFSKNKYAA